MFIIPFPSSTGVHPFILFYYNPIYLCLVFALPGLRWCTGFSLVAEGRDYSPGAVCRHLMAEASLVE